MRLLVIASSCLILNGCFFFWIPTSMFSSANTCVGESSYVGQRIRNQQSGQTGTLKEIHGRHQRCQMAITPILATVEYEER
jgi:hypothetical protein